MLRINIHEAKTHLSRYAKRVKKGETVILCDRNVAFAEIRPLAAARPAGRRPFGAYRDIMQTIPEPGPAPETAVASIGGEAPFPL